MKHRTKWVSFSSVAVGTAAVCYAILTTIEVARELDPAPGAIVEPWFYTGGCRVVLWIPLIRETIRCALRKEFRIVATAIAVLLAYAGERIYAEMPLSIGAIAFLMISVSLVMSIDVTVELYQPRTKRAEPGATDNPVSAPRI